MTGSRRHAAAAATRLLRSRDLLRRTIPREESNAACARSGRVALSDSNLSRAFSFFTGLSRGREISGPATTTPGEGFPRLFCNGRNTITTSKAIPGFVARLTIFPESKTRRGGRTMPPADPYPSTAGYGHAEIETVAPRREWRVAVLYGAVAAAHADARTRTRVTSSRLSFSVYSLSFSSPPSLSLVLPGGPPPSGTFALNGLSTPVVSILRHDIHMPRVRLKCDASCELGFRDAMPTPLLFIYYGNKQTNKQQTREPLFGSFMIKYSPRCSVVVC